jgi:hypothetical protein
MSLEVETERIEITGLPPGTLGALEELGRDIGKSAEEFARMVLEAKLLALKPFREILAPLRQGFRESGMTEDELDAFVEEARIDFHRERPTDDE